MNYLPFYFIIIGLVGALLIEANENRRLRRAMDKRVLQLFDY